MIGIGPETQTVLKDKTQYYLKVKAIWESQSDNDYNTSEGMDISITF